MAKLAELNQFLSKTFPAANELRFKYLPAGANLPDDWLIQTPDIWGTRMANLVTEKPVGPGVEKDPDFGLPVCKGNTAPAANCNCRELLATVSQPGMAPKKLCMGHSTKVVDHFYSAIISAQKYVLISTLADVEDGHFAVALRNAITYLGYTKRKIGIYILIGSPKSNSVTIVDETLKRIAGGLKNIPGSQVTVSVIAKWFANTWNHSKMLVIDANTVISGGHNYYQRYLGPEPVFDLSMKLNGAIGPFAHNFFKQMWDIASGVALKTEAASIPGSLANEHGMATPLPAAAAQTKALSSESIAQAPVLLLGRLSGGWETEVSETALLYMLENAKESIKISQQSLKAVFPALYYPDKFMMALAKFIINMQKDVFIVLSSTNAADGYNSGGNFAEVFEELFRWAAGFNPALLADNIRGLLNRYLHVEHINFSADLEWGPGRGVANHAKFIMVDDEQFYIGSQNFYPTKPTGLYEFGFIIESKAAARKLLTDYWDKLWLYSKATVNIRTDKASYKPGEPVWVNVQTASHVPINDSVTIHGTNGSEVAYLWTHGVVNGYLQENWVIPANMAGQTITLCYRYDGGIGGKKKVMAMVTFNVGSAAGGVELSTGKAEYAQNELIDVWIKVGGAIKDDTIRITDQQGKEEWWTWTNNITEGRIASQYKVTDKYMHYGQVLRIDYIYDGHNTRQVRQTVYCRIKPMKVTIKTDKAVYKVGERVWVSVSVANGAPYNDAVTFNRMDGKEDSYLWTNAITNGYLRDSWGAPAHLRGQTVVINYIYDGGIGGKRWLMAQTTFKIEA